LGEGPCTRQEKLRLTKQGVKLAREALRQGAAIVAAVVKEDTLQPPLLALFLQPSIENPLGCGLHELLRGMELYRFAALIPICVYVLACALALYLAF